jgi:hypothetical protein
MHHRSPPQLQPQTLLEGRLPRDCSHSTPISQIPWPIMHPSAWRGCMKSGSRRVFRYSSTHEKALPHGSFRHPMEIHRTPRARPQRTRTAQNPESWRDFERHLLPPKKRLPVVAPLAPRLPQVAHRLLVVQKMALREGTWERINQALRERLLVRLNRDPQPSAGEIHRRFIARR